MFVDLNITYGGISAKIQNVSVGQGSPSIKWLTAVAAQRFVHEHPTLFQNHHRPPLVKNVHTNISSFLHPHKSIKDTLSDGIEVFVDLYHDIMSDKHGDPKYSAWSIIAYSTCKTREREVKQLTMQLEQEAQELNEKRRIDTEEKRKRAQIPKITEMKLILDYILSSVTGEENLSETMVKAWNEIVQSGMLESLVPRKKEHEIIYEFCLETFHNISHIYKHFSASAKTGGYDTIDFTEFSSFVSESKILPMGTARNTLLRVFGARTKSFDSTLSFAEFFVSLLKLSNYKYIKPAREMNRKDVGAFEDVLTPSQALSKLYKDNLEPLIVQLPGSISTLGRVLGMNDVLLLLYDKLHVLIKTFYTYAGSAKYDPNALNVVPTKDITLNMEQFTLFATDHKFLGLSRNGKRKVNLKDIRQTFSSSQHDDDLEQSQPSSNTTTSINIEKENHCTSKELMIFPEFIVGLCRLGVLKFSNRFDDADECYIEYIKLAIDCI